MCAGTCCHRFGDGGVGFPQGGAGVPSAARCAHWAFVALALGLSRGKGVRVLAWVSPRPRSPDRFVEVGGRKRIELSGCATTFGCPSYWELTGHRCPTLRLLPNSLGPCTRYTQSGSGDVRGGPGASTCRSSEPRSSKNLVGCAGNGFTVRPVLEAVDS